MQGEPSWTALRAEAHRAAHRILEGDVGNAGVYRGLAWRNVVVFDYANPPESLTPEMRPEHDRRAARAAWLGEPWKNYWQPRDLHAGLRARGFAEIKDLGPAEIWMRYFPQRSGPVPASGGHTLLAGAAIRT